MLEAVRFIHRKKNYTVYYRKTGAVLPVLDRNENSILVPWGRRPGEEGEFLTSGWMPESRIKQGHFDFYFPKHVRIDVDAVMYRDILGRNSWHPLPTSHICGMLTRDKHITRVYVVTIDALMDDLLDWTPKLIF